MSADPRNSRLGQNGKPISPELATRELAVGLDRGRAGREQEVGSPERVAGGRIGAESSEGLRGVDESGSDESIDQRL